ncbi:hypothetical protein [Sphingobium sp. B11D3D]|uniref:hypothetical protein n=1 Tax=Sphingobium sp. B11D3D TaxID=2940576 RepID=UPI00222440ED|nr:hypothetical protein [Sphingobium sp. B11D3D]MCW2370369.1 hypothetical protein [Sphingobium sp. B11D3D]
MIRFARRAIALALLLFPGLPTLAREAAPPCDRACLYAHVDRYLAAVEQGTPAGLDLAPDFRATENGAPVAPGEGLWQTTDGYSSYQARAADVSAGQVAVLGEVKEAGKTVGYATRLKIVAGRIAEAETVIGRSFAPQHPSMPTEVRAGLRTIVPKRERLSRAEMIALADRNFDNMLRNKGDHFAPDCQRIENRMPMSGNPQLAYPITPIPGKPLPHFGSMSCQAQVEAHLFDTLDKVEPRRTLVVDEEQQVLFGVFSLRFYGRTECNDIPGYGRTCPAKLRGPMSLLSGEMLGMRGGKVREVELIFTRLPYEAGQGWAP